MNFPEDFIFDNIYESAINDVDSMLHHGRAEETNSGDRETYKDIRIKTEINFFHSAVCCNDPLSYRTFSLAFAPIPYSQ